MFKKNTVASATANDISDLLAKIHIEIQKELVKQNQPQQKKNSFNNFLQGLFVQQDHSSAERMRLLELCRDFLRNEKDIPPNQLEIIFAKAPRDIRNIYNQIKNFNDHDKVYCKNLFNESGYITSDFLRNISKS